MKTIKKIVLSMGEAAAIVARHFNLKVEDSVLIRQELTPDIIRQVRELDANRTVNPAFIPSPIPSVTSPGFVMTAAEVNRNLEIIVNALRPRMVAGVQLTDKIAAIKAHRTLTNMGLKDSKDFIERLMPSRPVQY